MGKSSGSFIDDVLKLIGYAWSKRGKGTGRISRFFSWMWKEMNR